MRLIPLKRFLLLLACSLSSCAMLQDQERERSYGCEMSHHLGVELIGQDATDCGDAGGSSLGEMRRMQNCAKKALNANKPLRFAMSQGGIDYFRCFAMVRRRDQSLWYLQWNLDASFESDDPRQGPNLFPQRCQSVNFPELTSASWIYFEPQDCKADVEAYERALKRL
jgi:hypothetical protein